MLLTFFKKMKNENIETIPDKLKRHFKNLLMVLGALSLTGIILQLLGIIS